MTAFQRARNAFKTLKVGKLHVGTKTKLMPKQHMALVLWYCVVSDMA